MEVHYKREMKHNYLIVEPDEGTRPGYEARMLLNNTIDGLLRFHIKYTDERQSYYYEITSMQPLSRILQNRFIDKEEISQLLIQIHVALRRMEEYLLPEDGLILEPDYIYVEPEGFRTGLCMVPGTVGSFPDQMSRLLQYLMKKVDHRDKECVVLAYGLYQESLKENYGIDDLMRLIQRERHIAGESGREEQPGQAAADYEPDAGQSRCERKSGGGQEDETEASGRNWKTEQNAAAGQRQRRHLKGNRECGPENAQGNISGKRGEQIWPLIVKQLAFFAVFAAGVPAFTWFLRGPSVLRRFQTVWLLILAGVGILMIAGDMVYLKWRRKAVGLPGRAVAEQSAAEWEMGGGWEIPDEEVEPEAPMRENVPEAVDAAFQTTLLAGGPQAAPVHRLESVTAEAEDIPVSYFPFIIGKYEELVDYVLNRSTVSRLHVRIDREGESYRVTDLNSTNGTFVRGHLLEANETVEICRGDEIDIADLHFVFR